jgi:hemolysin activation/secretion protein
MMAIVKLSNVNVQKDNASGLKYKVNNYKRGTLVELDYCDQYNWCKIKNEQLYLPKYSLSIEFFKELYPKEKSTKIKSIKSKCIKLRKIDLDEKKLLDISTQNKILSKYKNNSCINSKMVKDILKDINTYYISKGYITTKPFLSPQNIKDGQLDVNVSIGKIEKIIDSNSSNTTSNIIFAFAGQTNKELNLRDLETSLESINRVPSSKSTFKIKPSNQKKYSIVKVTTQKIQMPFDFTLGVSGKEDFKDKNPYLISTLSLYNPLSINDILRFSLNGSYIQEEYQSTKGNEINYSFSIGSYLLEFIKSYSTYRQGIDGLNNTYLSNGDTHGYKTKLSKIIFRNQSNKFKTSFSLYHKSTKNYFEDNEIETSSYKVTQIQLDFIHTLIKKWGQLNTIFSIYQGNDWLGARGDDYFASESDYSNDTKLEFTKYTLSTNIIYNFIPTYSLSSNFKIQYTDDNLYSSDKFSLGGDTSVRGYYGNYYGNTGWYLNNTITKNIGLNIYKPLLQNMSIYVGFDYGAVPCKADNQGRCGKMYGSGIGLRSGAKNFNTDFSWVRPLKKLNDNFEIQNSFKYTLTIKF